MHTCPPRYQLLAGNQILRQLLEPRLLHRHGSLALLFAQSTGMRPFKQATRLIIKDLWFNETAEKFDFCSHVLSKESNHSSPSIFFSNSALIASNDNIFTAQRVEDF